LSDEFAKDFRESDRQNSVKNVRIRGKYLDKNESQMHCLRRQIEMTKANAIKHNNET